MYKSFCEEFAENIIAVAGSNGKYSGLTQHKLAVECYAHAVARFCYSKIKSKFPKLADWVNDKGGIINAGGKDWLDFIYNSIWKEGSKLNSLADKKLPY